MTPEELREYISAELDLMAATVEELMSLKADVANREPTVREKAAAAAFLAQFYNGVENILKRISRYHGVQLPVGDAWHIELFRRFCAPSYGPLPELFDDSLAPAMAPFRRFRHVVFHGYSIGLEWERMVEGIEKIETVFAAFKKALSAYMQTLG